MPANANPARNQRVDFDTEPYRHPQPPSAWRGRWQQLLATHEVVVFNDAARIAALDVVGRTLSQIFVAPDCQRRGLGTRLIAWAQRLCPHGFTLKTAADNRAARAFYRRLGMREGGRSVNDFNGRAEIRNRCDGRI